MPGVLITGSAGFIGFHLAALLLDEGFRVVGFDGMTDYYDVALKRKRHALLQARPGFSCVEARLEDMATLKETCERTQPDVIVHLAAQAGVRHSLEHPRDYLESNVTGTFNLLECARAVRPRHVLMASTSSVYGANARLPFREVHPAETPLTIYAATKKANEEMAHCYAHLWALPVTMCRFFTVYGPWGRPDLALFRFVRAALGGEPVEIFNHGRMARDFTYVDDLVRALRLLVDVPPPSGAQRGEVAEGDSLSPVAPYRVVNIGSGRQVQLLEFVAEIENVLGCSIRKTYCGMQAGDVRETWADTTLLHRLTGFRAQTHVAEGVARFVGWYRDYYGEAP